MGCKREFRVFDFLCLSGATFTLLDNRGMSQRLGNGKLHTAQVERGIFIKAEVGLCGILESVVGFGPGPQRERGHRVICGSVPRRRARDPAEKAASIGNCSNWSCAEPLSERVLYY